MCKILLLIQFSFYFSSFSLFYFDKNNDTQQFSGTGRSILGDQFVLAT